MTEEIPRLRPLDIIPLQTPEGPRICLRDPLQLSDGIISMTPRDFFLCQLMNGNNRLLDIQAEFMRRFGDLIYLEQIEELLGVLNHHYLLDNSHSRSYRDNLEKKLEREPVRPPALADRSYPSDPAELGKMLNSYFQKVGPARKSGPVRGMIAPHIDLGVGWETYTRTYRELAPSGRLETAIILGTSHAESKGTIVFSRRDFSSPLGILRNDQDLISLFEQEMGSEFLVDEIAHRNEHSIEFQVLFLSFLFPDRELKVVPILCNSFAPFIQAGRLPESHSQVRRLVLTLKKLLAENPERFLCIAGADLAHVGPKFGDRRPADAGFMSIVESEDRKLLTKIESGDAEGFFRAISANLDARRICGLPPIYVLLSSLSAEKTTITHYAQWQEKATQSAVTFAGATI